MNRDPELGVGEHDGGDNITYGEDGWTRLISEAKNGILESWWLCVYNWAHFF